MDIHSENKGTVTIVRVSGRVDSAGAERFQQQLEAAASTATERVMLDCTKLDHITSAGLRSLLVVAREVKRAGRVFVVFGLTPQVAEVFKVTGFQAMIPTRVSEAEALDAGWGS